MDTKSRKSTKLAKIIITLFCVLPAVFLVSLYPQMEKAMIEKKEYYDELQAIEEETNSSWVLEDNFVNYAMEASYYSYAQIMNSIEAKKIDLSVFDEYGWNNDYAYFYDNSSFVATYEPAEGEENIIRTNADNMDDSICKLVLQFDSYGNLVVAALTENQPIYQFDEVNGNTYTSAMHSVKQFQNNLEFFNESIEGFENPVENYMPKNFTLVAGINEHSNFVGTYEEWYGGDYHSIDPVDLYLETGAYAIVPVIYLLLLVLAMTLPFVKSLNTGREKIFSMSFEVMLVVAFGALLGTIGMAYAMAHTTMRNAIDLAETSGGIMFVGMSVTPRTVYVVGLIANVLGWAIVFFVVYALGANIRQLISDTKYYLKYQTLSIRFFRWLKGKLVKLYSMLTDVDLNNHLDRSILKIVLINFVVLLILVCLGFVGIVGVTAYSVALFVILRKKLQKMRTQYQNVLHATNQMAEGDLKITLDEDLGVFEPIGESLEKVQQGFDKAVKEEAKSQNMKTELITNVSHDLKTPLTAIITYVDLLKKEGISEEERKQYIQTLDQKSQRLKILIEDLFEVSKAQSGNVTMNYMDVDVVSLLKQVKSEMDDQIKSSNLEFKWNLADEKVILPLDGQRTYRVFENLISNALKYSLSNSRVYVNLNHTEKDVKIVFRNVSAQELDFDPERLTDRFVRGDSSRNSEGSGLGLAIAKSFVELQRGTFEINVDDDIFKVIITWKKGIL